jgi:hypothetical protein
VWGCIRCLAVEKMFALLTLMLRSSREALIVYTPHMNSMAFTDVLPKYTSTIALNATFLPCQTRDCYQFSLSHLHPGKDSGIYISPWLYSSPSKPPSHFTSHCTTTHVMRDSLSIVGHLEMEELAPVYLVPLRLCLHLTDFNLPLRTNKSIAQRVQVLTEST